MNHREREDRRIEADRRADEEALRKQYPNINRAHREAERECLDLKERIKALESLLVESGEAMCDAYTSCDCRSVIPFKKLADRIDAILPKTEEVKCKNSP